MQGERVKEIRKALGLTLEKFGEKLGVGKSAISKIEKGDTNLTEQMARSICREYNVNYIWLTTGKGDNKFIESDEKFIEQMLDIMHGKSDIRKNIIIALLQASETELDAVDSIVSKYLEARKKAPTILSSAEAAYKKSLPSAQSMAFTALSTTAATDASEMEA